MRNMCTSEGNEEIMMVYTSLPESKGNIESEKELITEDMIIQKEDNDRLIIQHAGNDYTPDTMTQEQLSELLCLIEDVRHTGLIDAAAIRHNSDEHDLNKLLDILSQKGISPQKARELLSLDQEEPPTVPQSTSSAERPMRFGRLYIITRDGKIIQESISARTFVNAIVEAGVERVRQLEIMWCGVNVVSTELHQNPRYHSAQHKVEDYYINTHNSTRDKTNILKEISERLNLGWTVGINDDNSVEEVAPARTDEKLPERKGLYVITREGRRIQEHSDAKTYYKAVMVAGYKRVYDLHIPRLGMELIVKKHELESVPEYLKRRAFAAENDGDYFILINYSNREKMQLLQRISDSLQLGWTIGINE